MLILFFLHSMKHSWSFFFVLNLFSAHDIENQKVNTVHFWLAPSQDELFLAEQ